MIVKSKNNPMNKKVMERKFHQKRRKKYQKKLNK